jgi:hypothetical protein
MKCLHLAPCDLIPLSLKLLTGHRSLVEIDLGRVFFQVFKGLHKEDFGEHFKLWNKCLKISIVVAVNHILVLKLKIVKYLLLDLIYCPYCITYWPTLVHG